MLSPLTRWYGAFSSPRWSRNAMLIRLVGPAFYLCPSGFEHVSVIWFHAYLLVFFVYQFPSTVPCPFVSSITSVCHLYTI